MTADSPRTGVLFICLGNICRSPLAEGIFIHMARARGVLDRFDIDSCGTGAWHVGEGADPRSIQVAFRHGIELVHEARQFEPRTDFDRFPHLIAMDRSNLRAIVHASETHRKSAAGARLMRSFSPRASQHRDLDVPDPYSGGHEGFQIVYDMLTDACDGLLEHLLDTQR